jgi:hypothetical protein
MGLSGPLLTSVLVDHAARGAGTPKSNPTLRPPPHDASNPQRYTDDFCVGGAAGAAGTEQGPAAQYAAAKKAARANRALGTGASLSLSQP